MNSGKEVVSSMMGSLGVLADFRRRMINLPFNDLLAHDTPDRP